MITARLASSLVLSFVFALGACGSSTDTGDGGTGGGGACATVNGSCTSTGSEGCYESDMPSSALQTACTNATYSGSPCSRTNAVGGCKKVTGNICQTTWYYAPMTLAQVQLACSAMSGTLVTP